MNLDYLSYAILAAVYFLGLWPCIISGEKYWESVGIGAVVNALLVAVAIAGVSILWAVYHVLGWN